MLTVSDKTTWLGKRSVQCYSNAVCLTWTQTLAHVYYVHCRIFIK